MEMVPLTSLWVPILVSAAIVFVASSILHMVVPWHRTDFRGLPAEGDVMEALRRFAIPPGDYMVPRPATPAAMKSPEFLDKMNKGPVVVMTVLPSGPPNMGQSLALWFVYCVVVGLFAGYVASRALAPGAPYLEVFRFTGTVAFVGYSLALWQGTIWYKREWMTTLKSTIDGLVYGLLTGGTFGWLWPS
jgi:hypothetical protein